MSRTRTATDSIPLTSSDEPLEYEHSASVPGFETEPQRSKAQPSGSVQPAAQRRAEHKVRQADGGEAEDLEGEDSKPGTLGTTQVTQTASESPRSERYWLREALRLVTDIESVRKCGKVPRAGQVGLRVTSGGTGVSRAGWAGLVTCGSVHVCPVCSAKIARHRKGELHRIIDKAIAEGFYVSMLTLTQRHHAGQSLADLWDALSYAWAAVSSGRGWSDFKEQLGLVGWVKAVEVTNGVNGWHVHQHVLVISAVDPTITPIFHQRKQGRKRTPYPIQVEMPTDFIAARWGRALGRRGIGFVKDRGGADWRTAAPGEASALGDYVAKLGGAVSQGKSAKTAAGVAKEATLGAFKKARKGNRTPFQVLADLALFGEAEDLTTWEEFESVSRGRRVMAWSRGLRERFSLGDERTDEDIAAEETGTVEDTIFTVANDTWRDEVWPFASFLLNLAESGNANDVYSWLDNQGITYLVPSVPDS